MCRSGRHPKIRRMLPRPGFRAADTMRANTAAATPKQNAWHTGILHKFCVPRGRRRFCQAAVRRPDERYPTAAASGRRRGTPVSSAVPQQAARHKIPINAKTPQKRGRAGRVRPDVLCLSAGHAALFLRGGMALVLFCVFASFALYHFQMTMLEDRIYVWNCWIYRLAPEPGLLLDRLSKLEYRGYDSAGVTYYKQ